MSARPENRTRQTRSTEFIFRSEGVDVSYWESLLSQLKAHLARARLRDKHKDHLRQKLELLKAEQAGGKGDSPVPGTSGGGEAAVKDEEAEEPAAEDMEGEAIAEQVATFVAPKAKKDKTEKCINAYNKGGYSPVYVSQDNLELGTIVMEVDEDEARRREDQRRAMGGIKIENVLHGEEKALQREAKRGMTDEEASFAVESALEQTYEWSDKYRWVLQSVERQVQFGQTSIP